MHPRSCAAAAAAAAFLLAAAPAGAATLTTLQHRQAQQQRTIWRDQGTVRFFAHHARWLALTTPGRRALSYAIAELAWTQRELAETRADLAAKMRLRTLQSTAVAGADAFACIHRLEGGWDANTGNGYYGGLQMDLGFQRAYGPEFLARWGTADHWPVWAQLTAAARARDSGRGYSPWPHTARVCGLL